MKTLIIYDAKGTIIVQQYGTYSLPVGIPYLEIEIPDGKYVSAIDTTKEVHSPIYGESPKTKLDDIQEQVSALNIALAEVLGV